MKSHSHAGAAETTHPTVASADLSSVSDLAEPGHRQMMDVTEPDLVELQLESIAWRLVSAEVGAMRMNT